MSSVIGFEECPRCKNETLWVDYDCRTGEHDYYCQKCGCGHHYRFKWDGNKLVANDINYLRKNLVLAVKNLETDEIIWKKNVSEIDGFSTDMLAKFINGKKIFDDVPDGFSNIYDVSNGFEQLYFIGNSFRIDNEETLILEKVVAEDEAYEGHGLIIINLGDNKQECFVVTKDMTREDVLSKYYELLETTDKNTIESVSVTWFNENTNILEELV